MFSVNEFFVGWYNYRFLLVTHGVLVVSEISTYRVMLKVQWLQSVIATIGDSSF